MRYVIDPPLQPSVPVTGGGLFPVRRIFCVGRNYADHVREMGGDPRETPPVFFTKPADAVTSSGAAVPYATATRDFHFEGELVVAIAGAGEAVSVGRAVDLIFGYAAGCDLTRRDLQAAAKKAGAPWDVAKAFDLSAPIGAITAAKTLQDGSRLRLAVNGATRQDAALAEMIWSVPEIISALSELFRLMPGDLIFTGTPSGVGPLARGDRVEVSIDGLEALKFSIA